MIRDPDTSIQNGYDIHVTFLEEEREHAHRLFQQFIEYLSFREISYRNHKIFDSPVGPWTTPMWQVILPQSQSVHRDLGYCIGWLMLNRHTLSVMIHPNSKKQGDLGGGYEDHSQNMLWMGVPKKLKLQIFDEYP